MNKMYSFDILAQRFASFLLFYFLNAMSLKLNNNKKKQNIFSTFYNHKMPLSAIWATQLFSKTEMTDLTTPFDIAEA